MATQVIPMPGTFEGAAGVAVAIATRRKAHLNVIKSALGENDEQAALMCMRRFFGLSDCDGTRPQCAACPMAKGMGDHENQVKR